MNGSNDNLPAFLVSIGLHLFLFAILVVGIHTRKPSALIATNIIEATLVDASQLSAAIEPLELDVAPEPVVDEAAEALAREEEAQRLEQEREAAEALEREREAQRVQERAEAQRIAEEQRLELERKRAAEEEAKRKADAEAKRRAEAEEKRRKEEEARRKAEAEAKRLQEAEARRRAQAEADLQALLAAEEQRRSAVNAGLEAQYKLKIKQKIQRYWRPPPYSAGVSCELRVRQLSTGDLASVDSVDCGGNAPLERSLEAAANQASPFPRPDDPSLFDPVLIFKFEPEE